LKERHRRTCDRKLAEGEKLEFDEERGIINAETKELVIDIKHVYYNPLDRSVENSEDEIDENKGKKKDDIMEKIPDIEDGDEDEASDIDEVLSELKILENKTAKENEEKAMKELNESMEEVIDTNK